MKIITFLVLTFSGALMAGIHPDFISLSDLCPGMKIQANYSSDNNFTGVVVRGYKAQKAYMAKTPAAALCEVQKMALEKGLALKIFDGYRPTKAVQHFIDWAKKPEDHPGIKELFYPNYTRKQLFEKGFIAPISSHSQGSAVDLTLFDIKTGKDLDMGSHFDFFDEISNTDSKLVTEIQRKNRMALKEMMEQQGFKNFHQEWWHFSMKPGPYPDQTFDFDVE